MLFPRVGVIDLLSRQINDFVQKETEKNEVVPRPAVTFSTAVIFFVVVVGVVVGRPSFVVRRVLRDRRRRRQLLLLGSRTPLFLLGAGADADTLPPPLPLFGWVAAVAKVGLLASER